MKKLNVIQIRGIRGIIIAAMVVCCLAAGFIAFPGLVFEYLWNYAASFYTIPTIGLFQGTLLWGIIVASYFTFRKNKFIVCFKSPEGLDEDELKSVFEDIKRKSEADPMLNAMIKARDLEIQKLQTKSNKEDDTQEKVLLGEDSTNK